MTTVSHFFKSDTDESLGVFYPTNYLVATFPSEKIAEDARKELTDNGLKADDTLVISGNDFVRLTEEKRRDATAWEKITAAVSKIVGTEELHLENDLKNARAGAAFLAAYCPTQEEGQKFFQWLKLYGPLSMRRYTSLAIDRMV